VIARERPRALRSHPECRRPSRREISASGSAGRGCWALRGAGCGALEVDCSRRGAGFDKRYFDALPREPAKRERRPVELHFGLLRSGAGRLRFADVELPITGQRPHVATRGVVVVPPAITGKLELTADVALDQFRQPLPCGCAAGSASPARQRGDVRRRAERSGDRGRPPPPDDSWDGRAMVSATAEVHAPADTIGGLLRGFPDRWACSWRPVGVTPRVFPGARTSGRRDACSAAAPRVRAGRRDRRPGIASLDIREAAGLGGTLAGHVKLRTPASRAWRSRPANRVASFRPSGLIDLRLPSKAARI